MNPVTPVKPVVEKPSGGITITQQASLTVDVQRVPVKIVGTAHDINRVMEACQRKLRQIEDNPHASLKDVYTVNVEAPQEDE